MSTPWGTVSVQRLSWRPQCDLGTWLKWVWPGGQVAGVGDRGVMGMDKKDDYVLDNGREVKVRRGIVGQLPDDVFFVVQLVVVVGVADALIEG